MSAPSEGRRILEGAPEAHPLDAIHPAMDQELVGENRRALVVDFRAEDDGKELIGGHVGEAHSKLLGEQRARDLNEAEVGNIVHDARTIGIEEKDLNLGLNARCLRVVGSVGQWHRERNNEGCRGGAQSTRVTSRASPRVEMTSRSAEQRAAP